MHKLIAPAILIFLCGIGVGFSLFPHVMPQKTTMTDAENQLATEEAVVASPIPLQEQTAAISIPELPEQKPLTAIDQESYVLQLFSPTSTQVSEMQTESDQMKLLEQTLMISYLLSNCGYMKEKEYKETYMAVVKYLTNNGAANPSKTALDASKRARASYQMVYRHASCDDPSLHQMAVSLADWRNSISAGGKQ